MEQYTEATPDSFSNVGKVRSGRKAVENVRARMKSRELNRSRTGRENNKATERERPTPSEL